MMFKSIACAIALCLADHVNAETFRALPNTTSLIDLDTADGNSSMWEASDLQGANAIQARFRIKRIGADKRWAPVFRFRLYKGDDGFLFSITGVRGEQSLVVSIREKRAGKLQDEKFLRAPMKVGDIANLRLSWDQEGVINVIFDNPASSNKESKFAGQVAKLSGTPEKFSIISSTGEIEVMKFQLGTTRP